MEFTSSVKVNNTNLEFFLASNIKNPNNEITWEISYIIKKLVYVANNMDDI
jgi:hypothetical protein